jgi:protein gp37
MAQTTDIEWCDSTLNLQMGCNGCELWSPSRKSCYAGLLTQRYGVKNKGFPAKFEEPVLFPERLAPALKWPDLRGVDRPEKPWLDGRPRFVFLDDMGDTFAESLPVEWLVPHLPAMAAAPFVFLLLTKRPKRAAQCSWIAGGFPANMIVMTSITSAASLRRVEYLREVDCRWRGLSLEPLIGPLNQPAWLLGGIDWVIAGGESGHDARPSHPDWFRALRDQCGVQSIPFFFKQWGEWSPLKPAVGKFREVRIDLAGRDVTDLPGLWDETDATLYRVGKRTAGRRLDGDEWNGMPNVFEEFPR